ncbi:phage tail protein [Angustibacter speluncae]
MERTTSLGVKLQVDAAHFRAQLQAVSRRLAVPVKVERSPLLLSYVEAYRAMVAYARAHPVKIFFDTDDAVRRARTQMAAYRLRMPLNLDVAQARRDFVKLWAQFRAYARQRPIPINLEPNVTAFETRLRTALRDRTMNVEVNQRGNALPLLNRILRLPRNLFGGIVGNVESLAKFASLSALAFAGLSAALASTVQVTGGLIAALGQVAGLVAFLPALGLAGAAGLGALALAFTGLKDAAGPAAQVRDIVVGLKDEFGALRATVQDNFFGILVGPIRDLGNNWIPLLSDGLGNVAGQLGRAAAGILNVLNSQQSLVDAQTGLSNTTALFAGIANAAAPLTQAFRDLAVVGSGFYPEFARGLADASARFGAFIAQARADGSLQAFMQTALDAVGQLGRALGNIGDAFGSLFAAANASGGGFLGTLESVTGAFADLLARPEVQSGLSSFFTAAQAGLGTFLDALTTVLPGVLGAVGPLLGTLTQQVGSVLGSLVSAIGPVIQTLAPAFEQLAAALGPSIVAFFSALAPSLQAVAGSLIPVIDAVATSVPPLLAALAPVLGELGRSVGEVFSQLATGVIPAIADAFIELLPVVSALLPVLTDLALQFLDQLLPVLPQIVEVLAQGAPYWIQLIELAATLAPLVLAITGAVLGAVGSFLDFITTNETVQQTIATTSAGLTALIAWTETLVKAVLGMKDTLATSFSIAGTAVVAFKDKFIEAFGKIKTGVAEKVGDVVTTLGELPGKVAAAIGDLGSLLYEKGQEVIQGLIDGIASRIESIRRVMSSITDEIAKFLPGSPVREGPLKVLNNGYAGGKIVEMLLDPIKSNGSAITGAMNSLTAGSFAGAGGAAALGRGGDVIFNAPVGWDPDTVARKIAAKQRDGMALAGLLGAV